MPTFQQFDYIEILSNNQLARIPKEIDANLNLFDDNPEALLLRLISGTVNIEHNISNTIIFPRKNYTDLDFTVNQNVNSNTLLSQISVKDAKGEDTLLSVNKEVIINELETVLFRNFFKCNVTWW